MASVSSNITAVRAYLERGANALDCSDRSTAEALARPIRDGIAARAASRSGPDGAWDENIGEYKKRKDAKGIPVGTGLEDESPRMLDKDQLEGEITKAGPDGFTLAYGVDAEVKRRGQWFHNGASAPEDGTERSGASNQAARPFWGFTQADEDAAGEAARRVVHRKIGG